MSAIRICEKQCDTCIFKPGNLMQLRPGRLKDHVARILRRDTVALCHEVNFGKRKTQGPKGAAVCKGFYDLYDTTPLQLARRLEQIRGGVIEWVQP